MVISVRSRRERYTREQHERAVVAMRDDVVAATVAYLPSAGSAATVDAVDETLTELFGSGEHLGDRDRVRALWIMGARWRLVDGQRSAAVKRTEAVSIDEHAQALAMSVGAEISELGALGREAWRVREILGVLRGDQRVWADAWFDAVLAGHSQPRGLAGALGWSSKKTEQVSTRARRKMTDFAHQRRSGVICEAQRDLLDVFTEATASSHRQRVSGLDQKAYESVVFHVAGCEDCWAAWHAGRRALLARPAMIWAVPLAKLTATTHAIHARVATVATRRLGLGGGAGAAAAGGGAALGGKAAGVICAGLVCAAATAGSSVLSAVPILDTPTHHAHHSAVRHHTKAVKAHSARVTPRPSAAHPVITAPVKAAVSKTAAVPTTKYTPGDLPISSTPTSSQARSSTLASGGTNAPAHATTPKPAAESGATCFPGDLPPC